MKQSFLKIFGLFLFVLLFSGCATRGEIKRFKVQLDYIEASNAALQNDINRIDSMVVEQEKVLRSMRAEQTMNLNQLDQDLKVIVGLLDDSGLMVSKLDQRIENLRREIILPPKDSTKTGDDSTSAGDNSIDLKPLYDAAYLDQKKGNYDNAIFGYTEFMKEAQKKPELADLVDDALYGIAECLFAQEKYTEALPKYQKLLDDYQKSDKYVQSLFKKGIIFQRQEKLDLAEIVFSNIVKDYPQSPEAELSKDRLAEIKQNR